MYSALEAHLSQLFEREILEQTLDCTPPHELEGWLVHAIDSLIHEFHGVSKSTVTKSAEK